ncbi:MAG: dockerin type I repeat-containing protein [Christensenellaceae bacterium]|nr:dockerin type I repeat-containing protein [Christensenellaceae bacterium]
MLIKLRKVLALLLCATILMVSVSALGASAYDSRGANQADIEKLRAFFQQPTDVPGVCNGDVILDFELCGVHSFPYTDDMYYLPLVEFHTSTIIEYPIELMSIRAFCLSFKAYRNEYYDIFSPDVYGPLDLSGTSTYMLLSNSHTDYWNVSGAPSEDVLPENEGTKGIFDPISTHITSLDISDCFQICYANFFGQHFCTEFRALNCPTLKRINATDCDYRLIEVEAKGFSEPLRVTTLGDGSAGLEYNYDDGYYTLTAVTNTETFIGWYKDGELIGMDETLTCGIDTLGDITAVFAGDADGDGALTVSDAVMVLRQALGITDSCSLEQCDVNCSGEVEVADALMILRFVLGVN